jgi:hypothetical protein
MLRSDDGVWAVTVGPLDPEMYVYYFTADGIRLTDPSNPQVKIGYVTSTTTSLLTVPGDGSAFYDVQDVPHGEIRTLLYSPARTASRELNLRAAGYDQAAAGYPCLLLHGFATITIRGTGTAGRTTSSTICSRNGPSSRSWWSCRWATAVHTSTAMVRASRPKGRARSVETPRCTSVIFSRTSSR